MSWDIRTTNVIALTMHYEKKNLNFWLHLKSQPQIVFSDHDALQQLTARVTTRMRDILVFLAVFIPLPFVFIKAHIGVLMWSWVYYMNPHRLTWGFALTFPFAQAVAFCTLIGFVLCRDRQRIPLTPLTTLWGLFIGWMIFTTFYAVVEAAAWQTLDKVLKIHLLTILTIMLINTREKLDQLIWTIVLSVGFYGIKGGFFTLISGGSFLVWGPPFSDLGSNNHLGVALLMIMPLMFYLFQQAQATWLRRLLMVAMVLTLFGVVGTHSRGAFLTTGAVTCYLWLKSPHKLLGGVVMALVIPVALLFMPDHWHERMATIRTYEQDASAMGRIESWEFAFKKASVRLTGGGFRIWRSQESFDALTDGYEARAAHSIYFGVLGDHGWPGLFMFLGIGFLTMQTASMIIRRTRRREDLKWMADLARMTQVGVLAYATGGAFLSLSYFSLFWHLAAIMVITRVLMEKALAEKPIRQAKSPEQQPMAPLPPPRPQRRRPVAINWGPARRGTIQPSQRSHRHAIRKDHGELT